MVAVFLGIFLGGTRNHFRAAGRKSTCSNAGINRRGSAAFETRESSDISFRKRLTIPTQLTSKWTEDSEVARLIRLIIELPGDLEQLISRLNRCTSSSDPHLPQSFAIPSCPGTFMLWTMTTPRSLGEHLMCGYQSMIFFDPIER